MAQRSRARNSSAHGRFEGRESGGRAHAGAALAQNPLARTTHSTIEAVNVAVTGGGLNTAEFVKETRLVARATVVISASSSAITGLADLA